MHRILNFLRDYVKGLNELKETSIFVAQFFNGKKSLERYYLEKSEDF